VTFAWAHGRSNGVVYAEASIYRKAKQYCALDGATGTMTDS